MLRHYQNTLLTIAAVFISIQPAVAQKKRQITVDEIWNQHKNCIVFALLAKTLPGYLLGELWENQYDQHAGFSRIQRARMDGREPTFKRHEESSRSRYYFGE